MKHNDHLPVLKNCLRVGVFLLAVAAVPLCNAATIWNGPNTTWTKSAATPSDTVLAGVVVLTRDSSGVLYNTAAHEAGPDGFGGSSPHDTTWAFGTIDNYSNLTYQSLQWYHDNQAGGNMSLFITNKQMVMHIVSQDIYLPVKFIVWGHGQTTSAGAVSYVRSTSGGGGGNPPTVSISSPTNGASFDAPASVGLSANASVSGGTVTNVEYFAGAASLGSATNSPFNVTGSIPDPGLYALTAVATAGGISATSSVVNITVVAPAALLISGTSISNGLFSFSYNAEIGKSYVIQSSSNLLDWGSLITNLAASTPAPFSEPMTADPAHYYRVGRLPGP